MTKIDEARRLVYGTAALEEPDNEREIFDYETSKPHFIAVSEKMIKASGGKNLMPVRAMHHDGAPVAAGHAIELSFDDVRKAINIVAKITDNNEWNKCLEGTYTGFSIEGSYLKRWADLKKVGYKRYTAKPIAVALADRPMMDGATFDIMKADGTKQEGRLVGQAREADPRDHVDQFWGCRTVGHEHMEKDDAVACVKKALSGALETQEPDNIEVKDAAGDGARQEEEMDEKDIANIVKAVSSNNEETLKKALGTQGEDLKKVFNTQVEDLKKTFTAQIDEIKAAHKKELDEIEESVGDLAKALVDMAGEPEEEAPAPISKSITRAKDVDGADDEEEEEEEKPAPVRKAIGGVVRLPGLRKSIKDAMANPIVFGQQ